MNVQKKRKERFSIYQKDMDTIINLKPKEYYEMDYRTWNSSLRTLFAAYRRYNPILKEEEIRSIRVSKNYVWIFKVDITK